MPDSNETKVALEFIFCCGKNAVLSHLHGRQNRFLKRQISQCNELHICSGSRDSLRAYDIDDLIELGKVVYYLRSSLRDR